MRHLIKNDFLRHMTVYELIQIDEQGFQAMLDGKYLSIDSNGRLDLEDSRDGVQKYIAAEISKELQNRNTKEEEAEAVRARIRRDMTERLNSPATGKTNLSALDRLDLLVKERMRGDPKLSYAEALTAVQLENRALAWESVKELRGGK